MALRWVAPSQEESVKVVSFLVRGIPDVRMRR